MNKPKKEEKLTGPTYKEQVNHTIKKQETEEKLTGPAYEEKVNKWVVTQQERLTTTGDEELTQATHKLLTTYRQHHTGRLKQTELWAKGIARSVIRSCRFQPIPLPTTSSGRAEMWVILEEVRKIVGPRMP
jgi:hypothetical protein